MLTDQLADYFLSATMRRNKAHPRYDEFHVLTSSFVLGPPLGVFLLLQGKFLWSYFIFVWCLISLVVIFSIRYFGHYRIPMGIMGIFSWYVNYSFISGSGLIYSPCMTFLHIYLLAAVWTDKKWGWLYTFNTLHLSGMFIIKVQL